MTKTRTTACEVGAKTAAEKPSSLRPALAGLSPPASTPRPRLARVRHLRPVQRNRLVDVLLMPPPTQSAPRPAEAVKPLMR